MEFNNKKLSRTSRFIYYFISIILAFFLIALANKIIDDLDSVGYRPQLEDFEKDTRKEEFKQKGNAIMDSLETERSKERALQLQLKLAQNALTEQKASFENWVDTRKTTESNAINLELQKRTYKQDSLRTVIKNLQATSIKLTAAVDAIERYQDENFAAIAAETNKVYESYDKAQRGFELKVFLTRLLFVLPILILGVFMLMRKRKNKFWPLYRGFIFFGFYAFFFGLVPYLPYYGGYVRYTIGVLLSALLGIYAIKHLSAFIRRKKEELKLSTQERSMKIKDEVAEKALEQHMCPSCGKNYMINELHQPVSGKGAVGKVVLTKFCRHCGMELFKDCNTCGTENFAHFPHCYSCGDHIVSPEVQ